MRNLFRKVLLLIVCSIFLYAADIQSQVVINEIMYYPTVSTNEWFELYNITSDSINLKNWKWKDATSTLRTITTQDIYIKANSYVVLCRDSAALKVSNPSVTGTIIQTSWSGLNNTGDNVILIDTANVRIDSVVYLPLWGGASGFSLERINPNGPSNNSTNWGTSIDAEQSTPNRINSIAPLQNNLILSSFTIIPANPIVGDTLHLNFKIKNLGINVANNFSLKIYRDLNFDSIPTPGELINTQIYSTLNPNDSILYEFTIANIDSGLKQYIGYVDYPPDEDTLNNKLVRSVNVGGIIQPADIVINEIMYGPDSPETEWFELLNIGTNGINLQNWKWKDATASLRTITTSSIILPVNSYVIICQDSLSVKNAHPGFTGLIIQTTWSALNNSGDDVILINPADERIDSVAYIPSWGGENGFSLERINSSGLSNDSTNWGSSVDPQKSTPNRLNSITPLPNDLSLSSFLITPSFPLVGDTLKLDFTIKNIGINAANNFSLKIYNDLNFDSIPQQSELINTQNYTSLNPNDSLLYTYSITNIDSGRKQFIGYVDYSLDDDTLNNKKIKDVNVGGIVQNSGIVINEIMYAPASPEPEWIEIYNNLQDTLNFKDWKIADLTSQSNPITITTSDYFLYPNSYLVIAKNNSILLNHPLIDSTKIIYLANLPTLNNDADKVTLFNSNNGLIDEVEYRSSWGGNSPKSLERISPIGLSNDSTNWATSIDCENSSPTRINSVTSATPGDYNDLVINEIMFDPFTGGAEWIELYNPGNKIVDLNGWTFNESSSFLNLADSCNFLVNPGDYVVFASDTTLFNRFSYLLNPEPNQKVVISEGSFSLSNSGEPLIIFDVFKNLIDSVYYLDSWKNPNLTSSKGTSLERINPLFGSNERKNWNSCANPSGGTPGMQNSIYTKKLPSNATVTVSPNPFSPDGDGHEDFTIITYKLTVPFAQMRVKVFDVKGRLVRTLENNQLSANEGSIIFDGLNDNGERLRIGIYILYIEAIDDQGGAIDEIKSTVVVAVKL